MARTEPILDDEGNTLGELTVPDNADAISVEDRKQKAKAALMQRRASRARTSVSPDAPDLAGLALEYGPEMALSGVGEAAGSLTGPLAPVARPTLSGVGGVAGRAISTGLREGRLPTMEEAAWTFGTNAAAPAVARGMGALGRRIFGRGSAEAVNLEGTAFDLGVPLGGGELSPGVARAQSFLDKLPVGGGVVRGLDERQNAALAEFVRDSIVAGRGGSVTALGREVQRESLPALRAVKARNHALYRRAEREATAAGAVAPLPTEAVEAAQAALDEFAEAGIPPAQLGRVHAILTTIVRRGNPIVEEGVGPGGYFISRTVDPPPMTYREVERWVTDLRNVASSWEQAGHTTSFDRGVLNRIKGLLDRSLDDMVQGTPAEATRAAAKAHYRDEVVPILQADEAIRGGSVTPDMALDILVRARRPDRLATMLNALDPDTSTTLRATWFQDALERSTDTQTGEFSPQRFLTRWTQLGQASRDLLSGGQADDVRRLMNVMRAIQERRRITHNPSGSAFGLGGLFQAGAAANLLRDVPAGNWWGATADVLGIVTPPVIARALASPGAARWLAYGVTAPPGSSAMREGITNAFLAMGVVGAGGTARAGGIATREAFDTEPQP